MGNRFVRWNARLVRQTFKPNRFINRVVLRITNHAILSVASDLNHSFFLRRRMDRYADMISDFINRHFSGTNCRLGIIRDGKLQSFCQ